MTRQLVNLGTKYGGNSIDLNLVPENSTVISAGVGEDISFDNELIKLKNCKIIGIDPTAKSKIFIDKFSSKKFTFINKALVSTKAKANKIRMYINRNPTHASDSELLHHKAVSSQYYEAETIALEELSKENVHLLKIDIEGSEYSIIDDIIKASIPQVCIEFHHFCSDFNFKDTVNAVDKIKKAGYESYPKLEDLNQYRQVTFIKK